MELAGTSYIMKNDNIRSTLKKRVKETGHLIVAVAYLVTNGTTLFLLWLLFHTGVHIHDVIFHGKLISKSLQKRSSLY